MESFTDFCDRMQIATEGVFSNLKRKINGTDKEELTKTLEVIQKLGDEGARYLNSKGVSAKSKWIKNWQISKVISSGAPINSKLWREAKYHVIEKYHDYRKSNNIRKLLISIDKDDSDGRYNGIFIEIDQRSKKK